MDKGGPIFPNKVLHCFGPLSTGFHLTYPFSEDEGVVIARLTSLESVELEVDASSQ